MDSGSSYLTRVLFGFAFPDIRASVVWPPATVLDFTITVQCAPGFTPVSITFARVFNIPAVSSISEVAVGSLVHV